MSQKKHFARKAVVLGTLAVLLSIGLLAGGFFLGLPEATGGWVYIKEQPNLIVSPFPVPYVRKTKVMIAGSGFEPKQEISLQIEMGGVPSDISFMVKPRPVANENGAFLSEWIVDGEIRAKLLSPTAYTLRALDEEGSVVAHAPLVFVAVKKEEKKKK